jgi:hypothetical protein
VAATLLSTTRRLALAVTVQPVAGFLQAATDGATGRRPAPNHVIIVVGLLLMYRSSACVVGVVLRAAASANTAAIAARAISVP